jgi:pimeloyl-ACP methyl ester carboxylesterase
MLANLIIRPYRDEYTTSDLHSFCFTLNKKKFIRKDIELQGSRGKLVCSWYLEIIDKSTTCVIYCHGNSGSRIDSEEILETVLKYGMSLFCFDFSGCGMSDGDNISLGYYEKDDISTVVRYIYSIRSINLILWGRSMGAVASILYTYSNPHIMAMILDSPFSDFSKVADEMVSEYKIVPKFFRDYLFDATSRYIYSMMGFDIKKLVPKNFIKNCKIPTVFIHSNEDKLVKIHHSRELYGEVKGPKCFIEINSDHNTIRDKLVITKALKIVQFLIIRNQNEEEELITQRDHMPEFQPNLAKKIRHRKGFSQGDLSLIDRE